MELSEEYFSNDEEEKQPTLLETNADSLNEIPIKANYKKWIDSESDVSHISSIIQLEIDALNAKISQKLENNQKEKEKGKEKEKEEEKKIEDNNEYDNIKFKEEKKEEKKENKNFEFVWSEGGNKVKITGSFCDWKIKFDMIKDPKDNVFKFSLPLDNKKYQFKFIVDDEWKYSSKYENQKDDLGNINNCIDLTNYFPKENSIQEKPKEKQENNEKKEQKEQKKSNAVNKPSEETKTQKIKLRKESIYDSEYPSDDSIIPSPLPNKRYYYSFQLDKYSHQYNIGNKLFYDYKSRYSFSNEASSKPILLLGHVNLNHLISFKNKDKMNLKNCMSFRYREKACTFIYYK